MMLYLLFERLADGVFRVCMEERPRYTELEGFDSINAAEASCMLENSLGHSFPPELLLFGTASQPRTVDEIIDQVCEIAGVQGD